MKINIQNVSGKVIVNGKEITQSSKKKFDKKKQISANGIKSFSIDSDVNVSVCSSKEANEITAHLYGYAITDADFELYITKVDYEVFISCKVKNNTSSSSLIVGNGSICINNFSSSSDGLMLYIVIPDIIFEGITVKSQNANIKLGTDITGKYTKIISKNGNINVNSIFKNLFIKSHNGNVEVDSIAKYCDTKLNVSTHNGNADVKLGNIYNSSLELNSHNGHSHDYLSLNGNCRLYGEISSHNGNITVH